MDLLTKFSSIEIKPDTRISEADRTFCQAHQAAYDAAREALQELEFFWEDMQRQQQEALAPAGTKSESYLTVHNKMYLSVENIREQRRSLHPVFIDKLINYFNGAYHLTIRTEDIKENLLPHEPSYRFEKDFKQQTEEYTAALDSLALHYTDVLEQLFLRTSGQELAEAAVFDLKEKCRRAAWDSRNSKPNFTLKKTVLQLDYACSYRSYRYHGSWEILQQTINILNGIAHFEAGGFSCIPGSLSQTMQSRPDDSAIEFADCGKVQSMRLYKNHRADIKFHTEEYARKFVEEYLGTVPPC